MNWNQHSNLEGCHAYLGASKYHWLNYDDEKLKTSYLNHLATQRGTELHEYAAIAIRLGRKQKTKDTLGMYINDAIGYHMNPEQILYYSENCFGTADAISFNEKKNLLRIHDLKTGVTPAHIEQLVIYAALFCLEYKKKPSDIDIELRIYQNDEIIFHNPTVDELAHTIDKIIHFDKLISEIQDKEL